jgi:hypothetical protein
MNDLIKIGCVIIAGILAIIGIWLMDGFRAFFGAMFCILAIEIIRRVINDIANEDCRKDKK